MHRPSQIQVFSTKHQKKWQSLCEVRAKETPKYREIAAELFSYAQNEAEIETSSQAALSQQIQSKTKNVRNTNKK